MESRVLDLDVLENYLKDRVLTQPQLIHSLTNQIPDSEVGAFILALFKIFGKMVTVWSNGKNVGDKDVPPDVINFPPNNPPISLIFKDMTVAPHAISEIVLMYDEDASSWIIGRYSGHPLVRTYTFVTNLGKLVCKDLGLELNPISALVSKHTFDYLKAGK